MSQSNKQIDDNKTVQDTGWTINANNIALLSACISISITILNKLMRMFGYNSIGLVVMLYILASTAGILSLVCCIKNAKKFKRYLTLDGYLAGIALLVVVLV